MPLTAPRALLNGLALTLGVVTAVAIPAGLVTEGYFDLASDLNFKARLSASRVAAYVYESSGFWEYQDYRVVEQIKLPFASDDIIQQKVYTKAGRLVVTDGPTVEWPVVTRQAPIVVSGAAVGYVDVSGSLRHVLDNGVLGALLGILMGITIYLAVRLFPLRVLDRALGELQSVENALKEQNARFDAALTNMSQGLCMLDADGRLIIVSRRFLDIFGIPPDKVYSGMMIDEMLNLFFQCAKIPPAEQEGMRLRQQAALMRQKESVIIERLPDERRIAIAVRPLPAGGFVITFDDITERLAAEERVKYLAQYDPLTRLPNRASFYERMSATLKNLHRLSSISVLSIDLDHFKNINDTLGSPIGDRLLQAVAGRIQNCVRDTDIVARLGGDEFAVVEVPSSPEVVPILASRLVESIGAPYDILGQQIVVGVSIGVAMAPGDGREPDELMKNADLALYRAKAGGGGTYRFFEQAMDARMQARRALEIELRKAVVNGDFEVQYQPVISVRTGKINSCEALARWNHPVSGTILPSEFISIAEETGLIVAIGEQVLRQACEEAMRWPKQVGLSVNISPVQFRSKDLFETVTTVLKESGLSADRLEFEITEQVLLQESDGAGAFTILSRLRELGIRIAMDDFGTGYSSLSYLRRFPFDKIKIDQSFIHDLTTKEDSLAIVRAVVGLGSSLGMTTTAEGVETKEQFERLAEEGCDEVQGFLFSRPRPAHEIEHILASTVGEASGAA